MMFPKAVAMVIDPLEYVKTRRLVDLKFKVFHIDREGRVVPLRVSIGIQRKKVIESTIRGMDTVDLFFIQSPEPQEREEYKFTAFSSLGEKFKKLKERFTSF
jgi:hypothetical protein